VYKQIIELDCYGFEMISNWRKIMSNKIMYSTTEVKDQLAAGKVTLIDVRDVEEYAEYHIPGAVNIPDMFYELSMTTEEGLGEMTEKFKKLFSAAGVSLDKRVIIYEENLETRYGGSCRGYYQLSYMGHQDVGILDGGLAAWRQENLPTDDKKVTPVATIFTPEIDHSIMVTKEMMKQVLGDSSVKLLDNRDKVEWIGESSSPYGVDFAPRKGRIPGAKWMEWYSFMENDASGYISHFKSPEAIREICSELGMQADDDIIIYCFKGARAANTYVAMKMAGFKRIRNYYGSWNEWSRDMSLPIDDKVLAA
jgi:thiosulfate/3-mercaptopyruvate sulfurtransferase